MDWVFHGEEMKEQLHRVARRNKAQSKILDYNQGKQKFNRLGGLKVVKWEPPKMPEMGKIKSGQVLVQILDGLNSF